MNGRRIAKIQVTIELLAAMLKRQIREIVATNVPDDLRVIYVDQSKEQVIRGVVDIYIESESFDLVPEGGVVPLVTFWYKHYLPEDYEP